jgi:hypothetical protein
VDWGLDLPGDFDAGMAGYLDIESDGIPEMQNGVLDIDRDGIPESMNGVIDIDRDGIPEMLPGGPLDIDRDGIPESINGVIDVDRDGIPEGSLGTGPMDPFLSQAPSLASAENLYSVMQLPNPFVEG